MLEELIDFCSIKAQLNLNKGGRKIYKSESITIAAIIELVK